MAVGDRPRPQPPSRSFEVIRRSLALATAEAAHHPYLTAVGRDALASLSCWEEGWPETVPLEDWQALVAQRGWVAYDSEATLWYREWTTAGHRWVLAFDVRRFRLELAVQAAAIATMEAWVQAKNTELAAARRDRPDRVYPVLGETSGSPADTGEFLAGLAPSGPGGSSCGPTRVRGDLFPDQCHDLPNVDGNRHRLVPP